MNTKLLIIALICFSFAQEIAQAKVWQATPGLHWDGYWEKQYSTWIKNEVGGNYFKNLGGDYKKLPLDCADAAYGLRIYYSYKHNLPWKSAGAKSSQANEKEEYSNDMSRFDHIENQDKRVAALINYLLDRLSTETLSSLDSYSIALNSVRSGDVFMYKYCTDGSCTRHTYIIKNVNVDGTFDVLYGTQRRAKNKEPLGRNRKEYLQHKPTQHDWGFKRPKTDTDLEISSKDILTSNNEQYTIANKLTEEQFFDYVNASTRITIETPTKKLSRLMKTICYELNARTNVVNDAVKYLNTKSNSCMNESTYDIYSTPSRDSGIYKQYKKLNKYVHSLNSTVQVSGWYKSLALNIFNTGRSDSMNRSLSNFCSISVSDGQTGRSINLGTFYDQLITRNVSYHPNDNIFWRWGIPVGRRTTCHAWYTSELDN